MNIENIIYKITLYPIDMMDDSLNLESDMGIDSIKKISILEAIQSKVANKNLQLEKDGMALLNAKTLGELKQLVSNLVIDTQCNNISVNKIRDDKKITENNIKNNTNKSLEDCTYNIFNKKSDEEIFNEFIKKLSCEQLEALEQKYTYSQVISKLKMGEYLDLLYCTEQLPPDEIRNEAEIKDIRDIKYIREETIDIIDIIEETIDIIEKEMPITPAQNIFLISSVAVSTMSLVSRISIKGEINANLLTKTWIAILDQEPSLSAYFSLDDSAKTLDEYKFIHTKDRSGLNIPIYDIKDYNAIEQEKIIEDFCVRALNAIFDIYTFPLHRFFAFVTGDDTFELIFTNSHLVSDGLGNQEVLRKFITIYNGFLENKQQAIQKRDAEFYIDKVKYLLGTLSQKRKDYDMPKSFRLKSDIEENTENLGNINVYSKRYSKADTIRLENNLKGLGISLYASIVTSILYSLYEIGEEMDFITLNMPTGGKAFCNNYVDNIIGCFAQNMVCTFSMDKENIGNRLGFLQYVQGIINDSIISQSDMIDGFLLGRQLLDKNILQNKKLDESFARYVRESIKSNVYVSFVGDIGIDKKHSHISIEDYNGYTATNRNTIDMLIEKAFDRIHFSISYDAKAFSKDYIIRLFALIQVNLNRIIFSIEETTNAVVENEIKDLYTIENKYIDTKKDYIKKDYIKKELKELVLKEITLITHKEININDITENMSLEYDFGLSSISKINLIINIINLYPDSSRENLFRANTLNEFIQAINHMQTTYPPVPAQKWMLNYFKHGCRWAGYSRFIYNGKIDTAILENALEKLFTENEVLRMVYNYENNAIELIDKPIVELKYYDFDIINREHIYEEAIIKMIEKQAESFAIDKLPMIKTNVICLGEDKFEFIFVAHHFILDFISDRLLFTRFIDIYSILLAGEVIEYKNMGLFQKYAEAMKNEYDTNKEAYREYWHKELINTTKTQLKDVDNNADNIEKYEDTIAIDFSTDTTNTLLRIATDENLDSIYWILSALMYTAVYKCTENKDIIISHRTHGRTLQNGVFSNVVGNLAVHFPLRIVLNGQSIIQLANEIKQKYNAMPLQGVSYDLVSDLLPDTIYPDNQVTDIRINYLGSLNDKSQCGLIEINENKSNQRFGFSDEERISEVELFFSISNNQLKIQIAYPTKKIKKCRVIELMESFQKEVYWIISNPNKILQSQTHNIIPEMIKKTEKNKSNIKKTVVITGGTSGIGKATAEKYLMNNYSVIILSKSQNGLDITLKELSKISQDVHGYCCNINDSWKLSSIAGEIIEKYKSVNALVCCVDISKTGEFTKMSPLEFRLIIETNLFGTYNTLYTFIPFMKNASIVVVGSDSSYIGYPMMSAYSAAKHGLLGLVKSLAEELSKKNININMISPSIIDGCAIKKDTCDSNMQLNRVAEVIYAHTTEELASVTGENIKVNIKKATPDTVSILMP